MKSKRAFSGSQLKWLAIGSMLLDHTAKIISFHPLLVNTIPFESESNHLFESIQSIFPLFILIGRLAFPLFCFLLVEGFIHTSNLTKYVTRLFLFALISEIPYDLAFSHQFVDFESQNVYFTLLIGLLVILCLEKIAGPPIQKIILSIMVVAAGIWLAEFLRTDYGGLIGVLLIVILYVARDFPLLKCLLGGVVLLQSSWFGLFAFIPIYFYNGERGKQWKYFFYWFYPVHLMSLYIIQQCMIIPYLK